MTIPVQITYRGLDSSPAVDEYIHRRAAKLETFSDRVTRCRVAVEAPPQHHKQGEPYRVRIELGVPGSDLVVGHRHNDHDGSRDLYAAIDHAFDQAGRLLQDHMQRLRGETKRHEEQP